MQTTRKIFQFIGGLALLTITYSALADVADTNKNDTNFVTNVPAQYIPLERSTFGQSTTNMYIDRTSIKTHPYNRFIRTYTQITNYVPAITQEVDGKQITYHSVVIEQYANCDKKEYAKGIIKVYESDFGQGTLLDTNNMPRRWEETKPDSKNRQNLSIICSLPINP
ncbi:surface-adhesin protein E [Orbus hercynius]|uniref:Surface-adhesin protein E n=1 Tax=Orbus hercynius TaxID=593135 RepID=A0A495RKB2_9GAMM|nr:surface-adhesin E family protein [Orbus hercynius]RKS87771.1 surface-adhesin protein E [Orbus hercynius]